MGSVLMKKSLISIILFLSFLIPHYGFSKTENKDFLSQVSQYKEKAQVSWKTGLFHKVKRIKNE